MKALSERIDELENDLGRLALVLRTLTEACLSKGVFLPGELHAIAESIDKADGEADGQTAPDTVGS